MSPVEQINEDKTTEIASKFNPEGDINSQELGEGNFSTPSGIKAEPIESIVKKVNVQGPKSNPQEMTYSQIMRDTVNKTYLPGTFPEALAEKSEGKFDVNIIRDIIYN